jgi:hypothetical protein
VCLTLTCTAAVVVVVPKSNENNEFSKLSNDLPCHARQARNASVTVSRWCVANFLQRQIPVTRHHGYGFFAGTNIHTRTRTRDKPVTKPAGIPVPAMITRHTYWHTYLIKFVFCFLFTKLSFYFLTTTTTARSDEKVSKPAIIKLLIHILQGDLTPNPKLRVDARSNKHGQQGQQADGHGTLPV